MAICQYSTHVVPSFTKFNYQTHPIVRLINRSNIFPIRITFKGIRERNFSYIDEFIEWNINIFLSYLNLSTYIEASIATETS